MTKAGRSPGHRYTSHGILRITTILLGRLPWRPENCNFQNCANQGNKRHHLNLGLSAPLFCATLDDMQYQFTPAAERALSYAYRCSRRNDCDELEAEALLLGLLAQPECRAAAMLTKLAIDIPAVRRRWPELSHDNRNQRGA